MARYQGKHRQLPTCLSFFDRPKLTNQEKLAQLEPTFQRIAGYYNNPEEALNLLRGYAGKEEALTLLRGYTGKDENQIYPHWQHFAQEQQEMRSRRESAGAGHDVGILQINLEAALYASNSTGSIPGSCPPTTLEDIEEKSDPNLPHFYRHIRQPKAGVPLNFDPPKPKRGR